MCAEAAGCGGGCDLSDGRIFDLGFREKSRKVTGGDGNCDGVCHGSGDQAGLGPSINLLRRRIEAGGRLLLPWIG